MAFPPEDSGNDARTIYAKPFSKSTTEEQVRELFGVYGSIRRVKLRREAATNSFRGSVYIEFTDADAAHAAVSSPPQQPHAAASGSGTPSRFHVMMKADYERKRANATSSAGRDGGSGGGRDGGGSSSAHKRARHRSDGPTSSSQRIPPPPPPPPPLPPPPLSGEQHAPAPPPAAEQHQQAYQQQQQQQQPGQHWRQVAEEREAAVRALEESLRKEREDNQRLYQRLEEAQQRAQEAAAREATANQKVLARDVEIGSLKGEIAMLRTQGAAALERQSVAHKARVTELEASLQRLKDALLEKERGEREQRKAAGRAAAAAENGGRRSGAGPGNDGGGGGNGFMDDL